MGIRRGVDRYPCRCCTFWTLTDGTHGSYEVCPVCFWEDDRVQNDDPEYEGGANGVSLIQARRNYVALGAVQSDFAATVRAPRVEELPAFVEWSPMGEDADWRLVRDRGIKDACLPIAGGVISGEYGVIEGCAAMAMFVSRLDSKELDERMRIFECVAIETEDLPVGSVRELWEPGALARMDAETADYEARVRDAVFAGCREILRVFAQGLPESAPLPSRL